YATITTVDAVQSSIWLPWFFLIGMLSAVFHFANGLWTAAITWGLTVTVAAQRHWAYVCCVLGIVLTLMGLGAIYKFYTIELTAPQKMAVQFLKDNPHADLPKELQAALQRDA